MNLMAAAAGVYVFFCLQVDLLSVLLPLSAPYKYLIFSMLAGWMDFKGINIDNVVKFILFQLTSTCYYYYIQFFA